MIRIQYIIRNFSSDCVTNINNTVYCIAREGVPYRLVLYICIRKADPKKNPPVKKQGAREKGDKGARQRGREEARETRQRVKEKLATKAEEERRLRKEGTTEECWVQIDAFDELENTT